MSFSKQRIVRRMQLRRRNKRNHVSIERKEWEARNGGRTSTMAEPLGGMPAAWMGQVEKIIQRSNATKQRGR